ncbi:S8 family serine peptidase [Jiangella endophytica]|uniref:S8 family serine peptidase n=1 Tax=Jiangella endophytica TaxID=1623398 RepID=UPI00130016F6|nr:S8 family serine peptidase [Jiangella endophytica]
MADARVADARAQTRVTLITGDVVSVATIGGRQAMTVEWAERDGPVAFQQFDVDGDSYVIPDDAAHLVTAGTLDRQLFNITQLVAQGFDDANTPSLPVIVTYEGRPALQRATTMTLPGVQVTAELPSVDGVAVEADKDRIREVFDAIAAEPTGAHGTASAESIERVWLDRVVSVADEASNGRIGAPAAWSSGWDGSGVTVAVLDTGIDVDHPDLAGKVAAAEDFTTDGTVDDLHGHGTHVSSTAAGTGAASERAHQGVAFDATLLNGKVLDAAGNGQLSWIISGMEWAVAQGADVINMSLGDPEPSDGTDPLSQAVNDLTTASGSLFVIASGNSGTTLGSPGAADAALTVGAVDTNDVLASFSSPGPRFGDFAIKPDLSAPGVEIVGARAGGTSMGDPVDGHYTRASGTSMATPHVAGAAAILKEQHPDWQAAELKSALVGATIPTVGTHSIYDQGAGRLDLTRAVGQDVIATPAPLNLGFLAWPHTDQPPVTQTLTYHNAAAAETTLTLSLALTDQDDVAAPEGTMSLTASSVTIPAGGTATVDVSVDPSAVSPGRYGGFVVAMGPDTVVRTPVGVYVEPETFDLTIRGIGLDGLPANPRSDLTVLDVEDFSDYFQQGQPFVDGEATVRVPAGIYSAMAYLRGMQGKETTSIALVGEPEMVIGQDTTVTLDAREAHAVTLTTERPTVPVEHPSSKLSYARTSSSGQTMSTSWFFPPQVSGYAKPTEPVGTGAFEFYSQFAVQSPPGAPGTPRLYDVSFPNSGAVPDDTAYVIDAAYERAHLARIDNRVHANADADLAEVRHHFRPYEDGSLAYLRELPAPIERVEYVSVGDTIWTQTVFVGGFLGARMEEYPQTYEPGPAGVRHWFRQPLRPVIDADSYFGEPGAIRSVRVGDELRIRMPEVGDSQDGHWGLASEYEGLAVSMRLYRDAELLGESASGVADFAIAPGAGQYRVHVETDASAAPAAWAQKSTRTDTTYTIVSTPPRENPVVLPLLQIDYDLGVDLHNEAGRPGAHEVRLSVRHQRDAEARPVAGLAMWASYDGGATWRSVRVRADGMAAYTARLIHPPRAQDVSLRTEAWDEAGNRIDQTIITAYTMRKR